MPELPEVEVTRRGLAPQLAGCVISGVAVRERRLRWPISAAVQRLAGRTVHALARGVKMQIKPFLMDGRRIVGVGNIYASESLFRAGLDPRTPARRLSLEKTKKLSPAIKRTLLAAIKAGGSSLRDFVGADGN